MPTTQPEDGRPSTAPAALASGRSGDRSPVAITHAEMNDAYDTGEAVPLGGGVSWLVRYRDAWWVVYERGWLRVTDNATAEDLDRATVRLAEAEASSGCGTPDPES